MYINPIIAGVLLTLLVELILVVAFGVKFAAKGGRKNDR